IYDPSVLLLDEPLSNLDPTFRMETLRHIRRIQRILKITSIFVTHDQLEALSACDRIAVMQSGKIMQVGRPDEVYYSPANTFVAEFVGNPPMNLLEATLERKAGTTIITVSGLDRPLTYPKLAIEYEDRVVLGFKPEDAVVLHGGDGFGEGLVIDGRVRAVERSAAESIYLVEFDEKTVKIVSKSEMPLGVRVRLHIPLEKLYIYSRKSGDLLSSPMRVKASA
ncbi:MAG: sugar ABC transporter ATP-binding protein, partial [Nitrososphaerota archaeon]